MMDSGMVLKTCPLQMIHRLQELQERREGSGSLPVMSARTQSMSHQRCQSGPARVGMGDGEEGTRIPNLVFEIPKPFSGEDAALNPSGMACQ